MSHHRTTTAFGVTIAAISVALLAATSVVCLKWYGRTRRSMFSRIELRGALIDAFTEYARTTGGGVPTSWRDCVDHGIAQRSEKYLIIQWSGAEVRVDPNNYVVQWDAEVSALRRRWKKPNRGVFDRQGDEFMLIAPAKGALLTREDCKIITLAVVEAIAKVRRECEFTSQAQQPAAR